MRQRAVGLPHHVAHGHALVRHAELDPGGDRVSAADMPDHAEQDDHGGDDPKREDTPRAAQQVGIHLRLWRRNFSTLLFVKAGRAASGTRHQRRLFRFRHVQVCQLSQHDRSARGGCAKWTREACSG